MSGCFNDGSLKWIINLFDGARGIGVEGFLCVDTISGSYSRRGGCFNVHEKFTENPQSHCQ